jgi:hypothetical protein
VVSRHAEAVPMKAYLASHVWMWVSIGIVLACACLADSTYEPPRYDG